MLSLVGFLWLALGSLLRQSVVQFDSLSGEGENFNGSNLASDSLWISFLFNTNKRTGQGYGFIERDGPIGNEVMKCLGTNGHCALIRIAMRIKKLYVGILYPERISATVTAAFSGRFKWNLVGAMPSLSIPVDINLQYSQPRNSALISSDNIRRKTFKHIPRSPMLYPSSTQGSAKLWRSEE